MRIPLRDLDTLAGVTVTRGMSGDSYWWGPGTKLVSDWLYQRGLVNPYEMLSFGPIYWGPDRVMPLIENLRELRLRANARLTTTRSIRSELLLRRK